MNNSTYNSTNQGRISLEKPIPFPIVSGTGTGGGSRGGSGGSGGGDGYTPSVPQIENTNAPKVYTKDGQVYANSKDVAEYFGKQHFNLLAAIDTLVADGSEWGVINFNETHYTHPQNGQKYRYYDMTKDGFTELVMGFTGDKARQFKRAYIQRFNEMEEYIRNNVADAYAAAIPRSFADALQLAATQQRLIEQQDHALKQANADNRKLIDTVHEVEGELKSTSKTLKDTEKVVGNSKIS